MPIDAVVADANALLSAAAGGAAARVFYQYGVTVHATRFNCGEVDGYLPRMARKARVEPLVIRAQWSSLGVTVHDEADYARALPEARERMAETDPDDAHPLALAIVLELPLWSNDNDLADAGVERLTTAELLARLEVEAG